MPRRDPIDGWLDSAGLAAPPAPTGVLHDVAARFADQTDVVAVGVVVLFDDGSVGSEIDMTELRHTLAMVGALERTKQRLFEHLGLYDEEP